MEELRIKDIGDGKGFKVNLTKLKESIKKCETDKLNNQCKSDLQAMGIEFVD